MAILQGYDCDNRFVPPKIEVFYLAFLGIEGLGKKNKIGAGSFIFSYFAIQVIEEYLNFGLIDEIYTISLYVRVVAVLTEAVLGYLIVPKNLFSEDGHVSDGIAQFLKWAVRIVAITFIIQIGAGSFIFSCLAIQVIGEYLNFGLIDEIYTISLYVRVVAVLTEAVLGYSIVPKNLFSEDGHVSDGIAQFLKWAVRIVAITFIIQITPDTILAMGACVCCFVFCHIVTSLRKFSLGSLIDISSLLDGIWGRGRGYSRSTWNPFSL